MSTDIKDFLNEAQDAIDRDKASIADFLNDNLYRIAKLEVGDRIKREHEVSDVISREPRWDGEKRILTVRYEVRKVRKDGTLHKYVNLVIQGVDGTLTDGWTPCDDSAE